MQCKSSFVDAFGFVRLRRREAVQADAAAGAPY